MPIPVGVLGIPGRESLAVNELVFRAVDVPALGYQSYYVNEIDEPAMNDDRRGEAPSLSMIRNNVSSDESGAISAAYRGGAGKMGTLRN